MRKIIFIANIHSPHIHQWLEMLDENVRLKFATIEPGAIPSQGGKCEPGSRISMPAWFFRLPKVIRYVLLGLRLKFLRRDGYVFHAHNSSGYGLSALLSGKPFILTTYGSELFHASERGVLYQFMLRRIIERAHAITASSESMASFLSSNYPSTQDRVSFFSLGVKSAFLCKSSAARKPSVETGRVWISNRRMHPFYHIAEIVDAFGTFREQGGKGSLILLTGDADQAYSEIVRNAAHVIEGIRIVNGFIDAPTLAALLAEADFSISIPSSDQLSSSILESMACGCVPITRPLESYTSVQSACLTVAENESLHDSLVGTFWETSRMSHEEISSLTSAGRKLVDGTHSQAAAKKRYDAIIRKYCLET